MVQEVFIILLLTAFTKADHYQSTKESKPNVVQDYNPLSALINCSYVPGKVEKSNIFLVGLFSFFIICR